MTLTSKAITACALMILLCIGVLSFRTMVRDEEDRKWVTHTHLVIEKLQEILIDITESETGQRGYILTGQERYLGPYRASVGQIHKDVEDFRNLTSDNPKQQEAAQQLEQLLAARLAGLAGRMEIRRKSGLAAGAESVATGNDGEQLMTEIRDELSEMQHREELLMIARLSATASSTQAMKVVIILGNALAMLILLVAGVVIQREGARRKLAEQELKGVNQRLEQRTADLSAANEEIASFSYSVAHDLRAPLRQIGGYSNVLLQDYGLYLDAEARRYLEKIEGGARKMGRLVDDLLSLSKIGRQELSLQATALDKVLRQVVEELGPECSGREVEWQIGDLFSADCDPALMKQVFVNLLSNAVKYTGKREHAVIEIGQIRENDQRVIFVRDNGAGFEMQYVGKLFGVFQRLHKARDFEGTGVGLAIAQRIIRKHGGRIWAEAALDKGATFFFTVEPAGNEANTKLETPIHHEVAYVARS
jgi:signal transduction histidine kinase